MLSLCNNLLSRVSVKKPIHFITYVKKIVYKNDSFLLIRKLTNKPILCLRTKKPRERDRKEGEGKRRQKSNIQ